MTQLTNRPITVGVYDTTDAFRAIGQHSCVCFADDMSLIAVTGRSNDPVAQRWSALIAAAPKLLECLRVAAVALCSLECPATWRTGDPQPHTEACVSARAALAQAEEVTK